VKYEARLFTGDFNQAGTRLRDYLTEVQMTMETVHRDSGASTTKGRRFTFDLHHASDHSSEIALVVFNYPDTAHPKWKFKQHDIVELTRTEDIGLIKPEDGDTHTPIWGRISLDDVNPAIRASNREREQQRSKAALKTRAFRYSNAQLREMTKSYINSDVEYAKAELDRREKAQAVREEADARKDAVNQLAKGERWLARFNEANELIVDKGTEDSTGAYNFPVPTGIPQSWKKSIGWNIHYDWDMIPKKFLAARYDDKKSKAITYRAPGERLLVRQGLCVKCS
jgi:hypothetical protein